MQAQTWGLGLILLSVLGCGEDQVRAKQRQTTEQRFATSIHVPSDLTSIPTDVEGPTGTVARVRCATCHQMIDTGQLAERPDQLKSFHQGLSVSHGNLSCASCHDPEVPTNFRLADGSSHQMDEALMLCSQCHGPKRKAYDHGAHGGMNGHWDLSRGPRTRNHCVDCHNPHTPQIPEVWPVLPPHDRGALPNFASREASKKELP